MKNTDKLFLLEVDEQLPPQQTQPTPQQQAPVQQQVNPNDSENLQPDAEPPVAFDTKEVEDNTLIYKSFMRLRSIYNESKGFRKNRLYSTKLIRDKKELTRLENELDDKFDIADKLFDEYDNPKIKNHQKSTVQR